MTPQLDPRPYNKPEPFTDSEIAKPVALEEVRAELVREIGMRKRVYPRWAHEGKNGMTREEAGQRIANMIGALALFDALRDIAPAAQALRDALLIGNQAEPAWTQKIVGRVEALDTALEKFDRYKVQPPVEDPHAPQASFR